MVNHLSYKTKLKFSKKTIMMQATTLKQVDFFNPPFVKISQPKRKGKTMWLRIESISSAKPNIQNRTMERIQKTVLQDLQLGRIKDRNHIT